MREKSLWPLKVDKEFRELVRPLSSSEYKQLVENLQLYGCRDPIVLWNGVIVDGHNRYEICTRLGIPFSTVEQPFENRYEAISWICANQLGRRNITNETRKYLIGKKYEAEKMIGVNRNPSGWNQYVGSRKDEVVNDDINDDNDMGPLVSIENPVLSADDLSKETRLTTAQRIAAEYHVSHGTVEKYGYFTRALDIIGEKEPSLVPWILSGRFKVSHRNVIVLSQLDKSELRRLAKKMEAANAKKAYLPYSAGRKQISEVEKPPEIHLQPEIKNMPAFDPDAEITGLTLTIPSWSNSIERTMNNADLTIITPTARKNLEEALSGLQNTILDILRAIKE